LLRAHRDNEAFEHFSYVNEGIASNIRATEMMSAGRSNSFMEFNSEDDPRFANTVV
jgi:hypothetical protein